MKKNLIFYIPVTYLFYSRLKSAIERVSYLFLFPGMVSVMNYLWFGVNYPNLHFLLFFVLFFFAWYSIYEIGYLENDALAIQKEKNPTLRISKAKIDYIRTHFLKIFFIRVIIAIISLSVLPLFILPNRVLLLLMCLIVTLFFFKMHNYFRGRINIITYFGLSFLKYYTFSVLFIDDQYFLYAIYWALLFPLPRTIEHASKIKYNLNIVQSLVGNQDPFRAGYYLLLVILGVSAVLLFQVEASFIIFLVGAGMFFLFRLLSLIIVKYTRIKRVKRKAHRWNN